MKKIIVLAGCIFALSSCEKGISTQDLKQCNLIGNLISLENNEGTLFYTDSLPGFKLSVSAFYIKPSNMENNYLPLRICNVPESFKLISLNDSVKVTFSGNIQLLPPEVDATSLELELTKVALLKSTEIKEN
ncbi:hypothetical protein [Pedobacter arcticus]|uniref:hypothetical protein n=1 Tax=Pedobacter arcticus TaxID=752140 RepID=UPI00037EB36E|nr:hypothetical protein [Pedobacter arcticus]